MHGRGSTEAEDRTLTHAAFYGLYLRRCGYDPDEVAVLVMRRYPRARPWLEQWVRGEKQKLSLDLSTNEP